MNNQDKEKTTLVLLCVVASVLVSILSNIFYQPAVMTNSQIQDQTVNINQQQIDQPKVNINTATKAELQSLPGIGDTIADEIIALRPYDNIWEIADIQGIGGERIKNIIERIKV